MNAAEQFCPNPHCAKLGEIGQGNISAHCRSRPCYKCNTCGKTFSAKTGTALQGIRKPTELFVIVTTLLSYGCPVQAIVQAYGLDERTVRGWVEFLFSNIIAVEKYANLAEEEMAKLDSRGRAAANLELEALRGIVAHKKGDYAGIAASKAQEVLEQLPEEKLFVRNMCEIGLGIAYRLSGKYIEAARLNQETLRKSQAVGDFNNTMLALVHLAHIEYFWGNLRKSSHYCHQALELAARQGLQHLQIVGYAYQILSTLAYVANHLDEAKEFVNKIFEVNSSETNWETLFWANLMLGRIALAKGSYESARRFFKEARSVIDRYGLRLYADNLEAYTAQMWLVEEEPEKAGEWLEKNLFRVNDEINFLNYSDFLVMARIYIHRSCSEEARLLLERLKNLAETIGSNMVMAELLPLLAVAHLQSGEESRAQETLEKALALSAPQDYIRNFLDSGAPVEALLRKYNRLRPDSYEVFIVKVLDGFDTTGTPSALPAATTPPNSTSQLIEKLTERELEILQMAAEGASNQEIAEKLVLSHGTVKAHVFNTRGKLGAHNRTEAVVLSQKLGLIKR